MFMDRLLNTRLFAVLLSIACFFNALAFNVRGVVCDSVGNPEEYATVRVFLLPDTVRPAVGTLTDGNGYFDVSVPGVGSYKVNITSLGKRGFDREVKVDTSSPTADIGTVTLSDISDVLNTVTVTAQRPLVSKEIDRIGYDVQADADSKTSQLDEILKKVPLVSVDPDGTIKIKGSTDFKIYKNGRPNNSFSRNAKELFKALPASMIKKIEVITDPGSREDAEGTTAILNIVTMENTLVKGVMGSANLMYQSDGNYPTPSIWLSSQIDKVSLSLWSGYENYVKRANKFRSESERIYDESGNRLYTESSGNWGYNMGYYGLEGSVEIDSLNLISAEFSGYTYSMKTFDRSMSSMWGPDGELIYSYGVNGTDSPTRNSYLDFDGGINYQRSTHRKGETLTLSYLVSSTGQSQESVSMYEDAVNLPVPYTGTSNDFTLRFLEQTGQLDWTRPVNEANKFDVGVKYIHRKNHSINDQEYFGVSKSHSDFRHITQVFSAYFDYRLKWRRFGARAGLRYEFSRLSAKFEDGSAEPFASNLNDWVPNVALSYDINDANTLKLSYSTRINRPGISQLNPAVISTPTSVSSGNPDLVSAHHQSLNLNYNLVGRKLSLDLSTSYSFINNSIIPVQELIDGDILRSGYANEGKNRWFNIAAWANYSIGDKTSVMLNANINYGYSANPSLDIHASGWGGYGYLRVRQQLPWKLTLTPYAHLYQSTPGLYSSAKFSLGNNLRYGIDLQRSFLKENRLTVTLSIRRPFGKSPTITESTPHNNGQSGYSRSYAYNNANIVGIRIGYRFGSLNVQVKKTAASISNDDVDSRRN